MSSILILTIFTFAVWLDAAAFKEAEKANDLDTVVIDSFKSARSGYSSDEVILNDRLNSKFVEACQKQLPENSAFEFNWKLINLRKAGKLADFKTTERDQRSTSEFRVLAELVSRSMLDREKVSIDRIIADPTKRKKFDELSRAYDADADLYLVRKAAFQLRKTRRLRPELITRIADWDREIKTFTVRQFLDEHGIAPELPGVYIFHDESGYLYIGHSNNLNSRLESHLDESSNLELANHLTDQPAEKTFIEIHAFPADSRAKNVTVRRAYESELIRSRKPRFNILP